MTLQVQTPNKDPDQKSDNNIVGEFVLSCHTTVGAKIYFPFPFLTHQEKLSRTNCAVDVPCLLYALRIFSNRIFGIEATSKWVNALTCALFGIPKL